MKEILNDDELFSLKYGADFIHFRIMEIFEGIVPTDCLPTCICATNVSFIQFVKLFMKKNAIYPLPEQLSQTHEMAKRWAYGIWIDMCSLGRVMKTIGL